MYEYDFVSTKGEDSSGGSIDCGQVVKNRAVWAKKYVSPERDTFGGLPRGGKDE